MMSCDVDLQMQEVCAAFSTITHCVQLFESPGVEGKSLNIRNTVDIRQEMDRVGGVALIMFVFNVHMHTHAHTHTHTGAGYEICYIGKERGWCLLHRLERFPAG